MTNRLTTCVSLSRRLSSARTFLFVPGSTPDRFVKAASSGADLVVFDLEDAVAPGAKVTARENVRRWLEAGNSGVVRVNGPSSPHWADDVEMAAAFDVAVMIPKSETTDVIASVAPTNPVVALIETSRGVLNARELSAAPGVARTALGHIDLAVDLGIAPTDREALIQTRSMLVLAAAAAGLAGPIDGVTTSIHDHDELTADLVHARMVGMGGKLCIHPAQLARAHQSFLPTADEVKWASSIMSAMDEIHGATAVAGHMVDPPVVTRANRILSAVDTRRQSLG